MTQKSADTAARIMRKRIHRDVREVYFIQGFELKLIKIGVTNDTRRRLISMQTMSPDALVVLGVQICLRGGALEKDLHIKFAQHRYRHEWFTPAPEILDYIAANTVPLDEVQQARADRAAEDEIAQRAKRAVEKRQIQWMRKNGFAHLVDGPTQET